MLAVRGEPFDSTEYLFELKWNGIRALAARNSGGWNWWGRERADYRLRYPEMQVLAKLPPGTILDGKLIRAPDGLSDLDALLARHQLIHPAKIQRGSREQPVTYMVFDLLAHQGRSLLGQP
jgi:bifunctional non-homologous end joining protein LigD